MANVRRNSSSVGRVICLLPLLCVVLQAFTLPSIYYIDPVKFSTSLSSAINNVEWGRKSVLQLQEELRSRGLSDKGTKTDLMQRLEALNTVKEQHLQQPSIPKQQGESDQTDPFIKHKSYKKNVAPPSQNQTLVDMDSDEARRIENYLKKFKQQANQNAKQQGLNGQPNSWTRNGRLEEQRETIIDVTSTATSSSTPVTPPTRPGNIANNNNTVASTASTNTKPSNGASRSWPKTGKESRQFLSIDKDDFLKPYDAAVEMSAIDNRGVESAAAEPETVATPEPEIAVTPTPAVNNDVNEDVPKTGNDERVETTGSENVDGLKDFVEDFNNAEQEFSVDAQKTTLVQDTVPEQDPTSDATWSRDEPYPFQILGVEPGATMMEIKSAYRKKAMEFSPDKNPGDDGKAAENLRQLIEAFQVLSGGYKKGKYEKEYQMLQRLQRRREQEKTPKAQIPLNATSSLKLSDILPSHLYDEVCSRTNSTRPTLLPVQESSYQAILSGENVILNAPSGSGKTLGFVLPLLARLSDEKEVDFPEEPTEVANKRGRRRRRNRRSRSFSELKEMNQSCKPSIVVLTPSKDVSMQVGKKLSQYHRDSENVATVFGGVPIKRQKHLLQNSNLKIVVGMPGRILEYIKEEVLDLSGLRTVVLDEADDMLNSKEKHAIAAILRKIEGDYQVVLASATMPNSVLDFCRETMEMDNCSDNFVTLTRTEDAADDTVEASTLIVDEPTATVNHWHTATRSSDRAMLSLDIVAALEPRPRVGVVFVDSKAEVETVARVLALSPDVRVSAMYEGMPGEERSQVIHTLGDIDDSDVVCSLIVTTDLAARDVDLPGADLILQFGVPRQSTNGDLYDAELYTNRIKCAGRSDSDGRDTEAILLYDYEDEGRLLPGLQTEMEVDNDIVMRPRALPSPQHILEASYEHAKQLCSNFPHSASVVDCFEKQLKSEVFKLDATEREAELLRRLAVAMAALSDAALAKNL